MTLQNYVLTEEQQSFIRTNYKSISGRELGRRLAVPHEHVRSFLCQSNLKRVSKRAKHDLDDYYFSDESKFTATTWFIIGFLIGDGNIATPAGKCRTPQKLNIALNTKDIEVLHLIQSELKATCPVTSRIRHDKRTGKGYLISEFYCNSVNLVGDLARYGIVPRKSGKEFLPNVPEEFFYDFVAGLFTADGCICKSGESFRFDICACSEQFLIDIQKKLGYGIIRFQQNNIYRLVINQTNLTDLAPKLLKNTNLLSRKRELLLDFLKSREVKQ